MRLQEDVLPQPHTGEQVISRAPAPPAGRFLTLLSWACVQLLKGVGTKCWAPDAEYALHSVYQGGLFELRAGDELFVSVSSPTMVNADDSSSYFGAFRLDL